MKRLLLLLVFLSAVAVAQDEPAEFIGEASVVIFDDVEREQSETRYYIRVADKETRLRFRGGAPKTFKTGAKIKVRGHARNAEIEVESVTELESAEMAVPETRKILTLLVDFNDATVGGTPNGTTVQRVADRLYNEPKSVAGLYRNASLGALTLIPDADGDGVQDVYQVKIDANYVGDDSAQCTYQDWVTKASDAWLAANPGKDISIYRHRLLILPNYKDFNPFCTWGGIAQLNCGTWCYALGADPDSILHGVIIHELGHNFGLLHARTDKNNNGYDSAETTDGEYEDYSDPMGGNRSWQKFNGPHIEDKNWVDGTAYELRTIIPAATPQTFDLLALDDEARDWPGLRVLKLDRIAAGDYYVAFRRAAGDYNNVPVTYADKVTVHYALDGSVYSYFVTTLAAGQSFTDPTSDVVITATGPKPISANGLSGVVMGVKVCRQACDDLPPPNPCGNGVCDNGETYLTCPADCPAPPPEPIVLKYRAQRIQGPNYRVTFTWTGATGEPVKLYRNGAPGNTANDGSEVLQMHKRDSGTPFKLCDATQCSSVVRVTF